MINILKCRWETSFTGLQLYSGGSEVWGETILLAWRLLLHSQSMVLTAQHIDHLPVPAPTFPQRAPLMFHYSVLLHLQLLEPQTEHITFSLKPTLGSLFTPLEGAPFPLPCMSSSASPLFWSVIQPVDSLCGFSSSLVPSPLLLLRWGDLPHLPPTLWTWCFRQTMLFHASAPLHKLFSLPEYTLPLINFLGNS